MYVDGKHDGIYVYEFKLLKATGNMYIGIDEGRKHMDGQLYTAKNRHHLLFTHGLLYESGIFLCIEILNRSELVVCFSHASVVFFVHIQMELKLLD